MAGRFMREILSVSIHAPVKGATHYVAMPVMVDDVSIHAPVKGATRIRGR